MLRRLSRLHTSPMPAVVAIVYAEGASTLSPTWYPRMYDTSYRTLTCADARLDHAGQRSLARRLGQPPP